MRVGSEDTSAVRSGGKFSSAIATDQKTRRVYIPSHKQKEKEKRTERRKEKNSELRRIHQSLPLVDLSPYLCARNKNYYMYLAVANTNILCI
mmetsp:Transcript_9841/g.14558  ORF Transcript_9841/g.14558 Transcript_9841/m.14558 type:complete len:92 (+) Transcript_9841:2026-2301(+)